MKLLAASVFGRVAAMFSRPHAHPVLHHCAVLKTRTSDLLVLVKLSGACERVNACVCAVLCAGEC